MRTDTSEGREGGESGAADQLVRDLAARLVDWEQTLSVAESAAGGLVCRRITALPGSSAWFLGGVVAYSDLAKERWLGITPEALRAAGGVSPEAALAVARAVRRALGADWGAAETGIAGPRTGRRSAKPAGLAYLAVVGEAAGQTVERVVECSTGLDDREANQAAFAEALLRLLLECLNAWHARRTLAVLRSRFHAGRQ